MRVLCASWLRLLPSADDWAGSHTSASLLPGLLAVLAGLLLVAVVLRAWRRRRFAVVACALPEERRAEVREAVRRAEERTVGEILPVVLGRSDPHPAAELAFAVLAGVTAYLFLWSTGLASDPGWLLLAALAAGAAGRVAARRLPELARPFVSPDRLDEVTREQAIQEFFGHGLHETEARTGVLLFVSLFERRVHVLGDRGIAARVSPETWERVRDLVLNGAREGDLAGGLVRGIAAMGDVLAEHFPWAEGDRNEIPDRVVVREE